MTTASCSQSVISILNDIAVDKDLPLADLAASTLALLKKRSWSRWLSRHQDTFAGLDGTYHNPVTKQIIDASRNVTNYTLREEIEANLTEDVRRTLRGLTQNGEVIEAISAKALDIATANSADHASQLTIEDSWRDIVSASELRHQHRPDRRHAREKRDRGTTRLLIGKPGFALRMQDYSETIRDDLRTNSIDKKGRKHPLAAWEIESGDIDRAALRAVCGSAGPWLLATVDELTDEKLPRDQFYERLEKSALCAYGTRSAAPPRSISTKSDNDSDGDRLSDA